MNTRSLKIRPRYFLPAALLALVVATPSFAGQRGGVGSQPETQDQQEKQQQRQYNQQQRAAPAAQPSRGHGGSVQQPGAQPPAVVAQPPGSNPPRTYARPPSSTWRGNDYRGNDYRDNRYYQRLPNGATYLSDRRDYRPGPQHGGRVIPVLPSGHRSYSWNGRPYYWGGGHWYRPYGSSFVVVGPPVGLFVSTLPYYSSVWVGGSRYYYYDNTYYTYEPARRGYVVTRSPYNDDDVDSDDAGTSSTDSELYIYPMNGQSEQQQAEDKYQCHRWAADQTHYDPTNATYDASKRTEYDRAMTACLTGRGYSVK